MPEVISRPALLLDEEICRNNISRIADKFKRLNVTFRPHFKTHQSHEVGRWFRDYGVTCITVSSVAMAEYFAMDGWKDITIAFPINPNEAVHVARLAGRIDLNVCVVSPGIASALSRSLRSNLGVLIEIDNGYHRTGVEPAERGTLEAIIQEVDSAPNLNFRGFLSHAGHSYKCRSRAEIIEVHQKTTKLMFELGALYRKDYPDLCLSVGDTPTCSVAENFEGITEVRPGNIAFYDLMQTVIGSCSVNDIAVALACPVVAKYPERNELVVHGGAVHLSKDLLLDESKNPNYGQIATWRNDWWESTLSGMYLKSLSQEHGIVHATAEEQEAISIGDVLPILPVHSCLTADAMKSYRLRNGEMLAMM